MFAIFSEISWALGVIYDLWFSNQYGERLKKARLWTAYSNKVLNHLAFKNSKVPHETRREYLESGKAMTRAVVLRIIFGERMAHVRKQSRVTRFLLRSWTFQTIISRLGIDVDFRHSNGYYEDRNAFWDQSLNGSRLKAYAHLGEAASEVFNQQADLALTKFDNFYNSNPNLTVEELNQAKLEIPDLLDHQGKNPIVTSGLKIYSGGLTKAIPSISLSDDDYNNLTHTHLTFRNATKQIQNIEQSKQCIELRDEISKRILKFNQGIIHEPHPFKLNILLGGNSTVYSQATQTRFTALEEARHLMNLGAEKLRSIHQRINHFNSELPVTELAEKETIHYRRINKNLRELKEFITKNEKEFTQAPFPAGSTEGFTEQEIIHVLAHYTIQKYGHNSYQLQDRDIYRLVCLLDDEDLNSMTNLLNHNEGPNVLGLDWNRFKRKPDLNPMSNKNIEKYRLEYKELINRVKKQVSAQDNQSYFKESIQTNKEYYQGSDKYLIGLMLALAGNLEQQSPVSKLKKLKTLSNLTVTAPQVTRTNKELISELMKEFIEYRQNLGETTELDFIGTNDFSLEDSEYQRRLTIVEQIKTEVIQDIADKKLMNLEKTLENETLREKGEHIQEVVNSLFDPFTGVVKNKTKRSPIIMSRGLNRVDANTQAMEAMAQESQSVDSTKTLTEENYLKIVLIKDIMRRSVQKYSALKETQKPIHADDHRYRHVGVLYTYVQKRITQPFVETPETLATRTAITQLINASEALIKLVVDHSDFDELLDDDQYDFIHFRKHPQNNSSEDQNEFEEASDHERLERVKSNVRYTEEEQKLLLMIADQALVEYTRLTQDSCLYERFNSLFDQANGHKIGRMAGVQA